MKVLEPFLIRFTHKVVFSDRDGNVLQTYNVGDEIAATAENNHYFVTSMGGIYFTEAERVS